jgi:D-sedoheptulose 7-phosphate isomerase
MHTFKGYLTELGEVLKRLPLPEAERICDVLYRAYERDRTIFLFGNGGSAALASHIVCDLGKGTHVPHPQAAAMKPIKRLKVHSLTDNVPMMTAWANDQAYEDVFAEQLRNFVQPGDVAFGISGSGNSRNVLKALELAREKGAVTVGLTGFEGGKMKALLDHGIVVPSNCMQHIEDVHTILAHMIFLNLKERVGQLAQVAAHSG